MTYTPDTPIAGPSQGSADAWFEWASGRGAERPDDVRQYLETVYEFAPKAGLRAELIVTQSIHETSTNGVPWASYWWKERCNPAGIGITGDPNQNAASRVFRNGREAALAHLVHIHLYVKGKTLPEGLSPEMDPRWNAAAGVASIVGKKTTLGSFGSDGRTTTWAVDPQYGAKWAGWLNRLASVFEGIDVDTTPADDGDTGGSEMAGWQQVRFDGLDRDVWLPDDIEVIIDIVPDRFIGWVRSGQRFTGQTKSTFHDPGVSGQNAWSQRNYLHNGPSENGQRRQVGFNFASDDARIIQLTPLDEVTWAAGTPEGNRTSWHNEACYGPNINWDRALRIAVALHAGLIEAKGLQVDTALVKHQYWFGKYCPAQILNRGLWPSVVAMVSRQVEAIKAAKAGVPVATISKGDTVATTVALNFRTNPDTTSGIVMEMPPGTELTVVSDPEKGAGGYTWVNVTGQGKTGMVQGFVAVAALDGTPYLVVTKDAEEPKPEEPPVYPKPLAIAELAPYVGRPVVPMAPIIVLGDGAWAVPVFDRVRALKDTPRRRDATGDARVGPDIAKGEEFDVSFLVLGDAPHYVTPWWTRVTAADCEVISDVPKDIEPAAGLAA